MECCSYGPPTEEGEEEDANGNGKARATTSTHCRGFWKIKRRISEKHDRYLEFICRLSKNCFEVRHG